MWIKIPGTLLTSLMSTVTSFTLVWIKITSDGVVAGADSVTSFTLVWIKIEVATSYGLMQLSHELHARVD